MLLHLYIHIYRVVSDEGLELSQLIHYTILHLLRNDLFYLHHLCY